MPNPNNEIVVIDAQTTEIACLSDDEQKALEVYQKRGGKPLASETAMAFFQLYLNGYDSKEIQRMNSAFPIEAINWAKLTYNWEHEKRLYVAELMNKIKEKTMKAQLDATNFLADLLTASSKLYGTKIKKFLQTGNEKDLGGYMPVASIKSLVQLIEGLQKVTGYNPPVKVQTEKNININVNDQSPNGTPQSADQVLMSDPSLSSDEAAAVLGIMAQSKRRRRNDPK